MEADVASVDLSSGHFNWVRLLLTVITGAALAIFLFANAVANVNQSSSPETALKFRANDPVALGHRADELIATGSGSTKTDALIVSLARRSLAASLINSRALEAIGTVYGKAGNARGRPYFNLAGQLSRRDLGVQFWLIEDGARSGNVAQALKHYDIALRTFEESKSILFPVLARALEGKQIWPQFKPYINGPPPWLGDFFRYAFRQSPRPEAFAGLLEQSGGLPQNDELDSLQSELLRRLVDVGKFAEAKAFYLSHADADPNALESLALNAATARQRYAPLTWQTMTYGGVDADLDQRESGAYVIRATLNSEVSGIIARKVVFLAPGRYRLVSRLRIVGDSDDASVQWDLKCARGATATTFWMSKKFTSRTGGELVGTVDIPEGCDAIIANVTGFAGIDATLIEFAVLSASIRPVGAGR